MPNYVTSRCAVRGPAKEVERFKASVIRAAPDQHSDAGGLMLDFDAIIPMPTCLKDSEASSNAEMGARMILLRGERGAPFADIYDFWSKRVRQDLEMTGADASDVARTYLAKHPEVEAAGRARLQRVLETGYVDWYPWAIDNWGTKWGAFRFEGEDPYEFRFETAWSFPAPVFEKLAEMFPDLSFACVCHDEGDNFSGVGSFNPLPGEDAFTIVEASDALYERAYGYPRPAEDEDEEDLTA